MERSGRFKVPAFQLISDFGSAASRSSPVAFTNAAFIPDQYTRSRGRAALDSCAPSPQIYCAPVLAALVGSLEAQLAARSAADMSQAKSMITCLREPPRILITSQSRATPPAKSLYWRYLSQKQNSCTLSKLTLMCFLVGVLCVALCSILRAASESPCFWWCAIWRSQNFALSGNLRCTAL